MSLRLKVSQFISGKNKPMWGARVTLNGFDGWIYGRTRAEALKKLRTQLSRLEVKYAAKNYRLKVCAEMTSGALFLMGK
jgi:hypothetical protein